MGINQIIKGVLVSTEYATHARTKGSKILFYHDINDDLRHPAYTDMSTPLDQFLSHITFIRQNGFEIVPRISNSSGQILISFDDGWKGVYEYKDTLLANNVFPVVCIAPGLLNHPGYLSDSQVKELHSLGFGFVSHSWSHQSLTLFNGNKDSLRKEILDSKSYIEDLLSAEVDTLCYPNGLFSEDVYQATLSHGYKDAWSVVDGDYYEEVMPHVKKRCLVQFSSLSELKKTLHGANRIMGRKHFNSTYRK